jgi:creatinine amidohydrolase
MPYGASGEHRAFPGTLSIGTEALTAVLVEFVRHASLAWRHVLVINGHGGNAPALHRAAELMRYEGRSMTVHHAASSEPGADPHAGHRETSLMLYLEPDSVHTDLLAAGNTDPLESILPQLASSGVRAVSENGVLGDPTDASAADGERIFAAMTVAAVARARRLLDAG